MMMDDIEEGVGIKRDREFNERELKEGGRKRYSRMVLPYKNNSCWIDYYDLLIILIWKIHSIIDGLMAAPLLTLMGCIACIAETIDIINAETIN